MLTGSPEVHAGLLVLAVLVALVWVASVNLLSVALGWAIVGDLPPLTPEEELEWRIYLSLWTGTWL